MLRIEGYWKGRGVCFFFVEAHLLRNVSVVHRILCVCKKLASVRY